MLLIQPFLFLALLVRRQCIKALSPAAVSNLAPYLESYSKDDDNPDDYQCYLHFLSPLINLCHRAWGGLGILDS